MSDQDAYFQAYENFGWSPPADGKDANAYGFENYGAVYPAFVVVEQRPPAWGVTPLKAGTFEVYTGASDANAESYENFT